MESITLGINVVMPMVLLTILGQALGRFDWLDKKTAGQMNRLVFRILMPVQLFLSASNLDLANGFSSEEKLALALVLVAVMVMVFCATVVCKLRAIEAKKSAIIVQGMYRSNLALFGLPIATALCGGEVPAIASLMLLIVVPYFNLISAVLLSRAAAGDGDAGALMKNIITNPLILGNLLGFVFCLTGWQLPIFLGNTLETISAAAIPMAFIVLGATLEIPDLRKNWRTISVVTLMRLVAIPASVLLVGILIGVRGPALAVVLSAVASPVAVASFSMAKEMDVAPALAGELVAVTTIVSGLTLFLWIIAFSYFQLF